MASLASLARHHRGASSVPEFQAQLKLGNSKFGKFIHKTSSQMLIVYVERHIHVKEYIVVIARFFDVSGKHVKKQRVEA